MKIKDLKVGHVYQIEFLCGDPSCDYCGKAKYCGLAPDYYEEGTLEFALLEDDEIDLGYFDIENVTEYIGPDERKYRSCPHCGGLIEIDKI